MKTLGQRDFSAQETMHHLLSLNLVSSSFNVVPKNLNGSRRLNIATQPDDKATTYSLLDVYAEREKYQDTVKCDLRNLNFLHFAIKYKPVNGKLIDQPDNLVPRVFPTYSSNPKSTNFGLYCVMEDVCKYLSFWNLLECKVTQCVCQNFLRSRYGAVWNILPNDVIIK